LLVVKNILDEPGNIMPDAAPGMSPFGPQAHPPV